MKEIPASVFQRKAAEIEKIIEICKKNGIELINEEGKVSLSVFKLSPKKLEEAIRYIKKEYGTDYLIVPIISKGKNYLEKVLPYLKGLGVLEIIKTSTGIFANSFEEIKNKVSFLESIGESIVVDGKIHKIFNMTKSRYEEYKKRYVETKKVAR